MFIGDDSGNKIQFILKYKIITSKTLRELFVKTTLDVIHIKFIISNSFSIRRKYSIRCNALSRIILQWIARLFVPQTTKELNFSSPSASKAISTRLHITLASSGIFHHHQYYRKTVGDRSLEAASSDWTTICTALERFRDIGCKLQMSRCTWHL